MIYTVTLNPSLDYIIYVEKYQEGRVNRTEREDILPGGKGINVSVVLKNLGHESTALGFVGGFVGAEISRRLGDMGIKTDFAETSGNSRINVKLKAECETEINASGPGIYMTKLYNKLEGIGKGDYLLLAGNAPYPTAYADVMERVDKNVKVIVDAEGELLLETLKYGPFLIKPNHHELGEILGKEIKNYADAAEGAKMLIDKGAKNVFVSMSEKGGVFVSKNEAYAAKAPKGKAINSTGAGDSAIAGFISGFIETSDVKAAFLKGICTGSASAFSHEFAKEEQVKKMMEEIYVSRI